ncbi:lysophospholipid acyltransferase family protein [Dendrosporobacter sp. 1207_IL3150]|uniref:lysophospholipid acyltransferase family protein n=1 Tax=Dendrosporobacter sp. 1207_IL3150 TaxID=3084054 RepID=UPI002FD8AB28
MQYKILKVISFIVCLMPYGMVLALGKVVGKLYYYAAGRQRKRAIVQMQESLGISTKQAENLAVGLFNNLGQTFLEVMYMPALTPEKIRRYVEVENMHYLDEALAEGRGVVMLTAHIGNWEWLGATLAMAKLPITTVIKRQPNDQHTQILNEYREMVGIEVFARGTTELVAAAKALKQGKILAFLADQDGGKAGMFIEFLGKMAATPLGPSVFAKRFKSPIVPTFIVRNPSGGHKVLIRKPLYYENTGDENKDLYTITEKTTKVIEDIVKEYPDQWLWFQKRWNTKYEEADINANVQQTAATEQRGQ